MSERWTTTSQPAQPSATAATAAIAAATARANADPAASASSVAPAVPGWSASVVAFGMPSDPRTASGYPRRLADAMRARGRLRREFSARIVKPWDVCRGAFTVARSLGRWKPGIRRAWMWSERGSRLLSERTSDAIRRSGDRGTFVQVGTLVEIDADLGGPHLMRTDMTIAQARRAGNLFAITQFGERTVDAAERVQARVLGAADHVLAATRWVAESLTRDCGVAADRITVVYPGPGTEIPADIGGAADAARNSDGREILFVGRDWERKGGPLLYDAFKLLRRRMPAATLRIVGCRPALDDAAVFVEGSLDSRDPAQARRLAACYVGASCFCLPSHFEPFGIALSEAAAVGLPAVSVDTGSRGEAIVNGVTGVLAPEPTAAALADALFDVLADPARRRAMGDAARAHAREHFSWDATDRAIGQAIDHCRQTEIRRPVNGRPATRDVGGVNAAASSSDAESPQLVGTL